MRYFYWEIVKILERWGHFDIYDLIFHENSNDYFSTHDRQFKNKLNIH